MLDIFTQGEMNTRTVLPEKYCLTIKEDVSRHFSVHCTASGKLILAHMSPHDLVAFLDEPLTKYCERTIVPADKLHRQLELIHQKGYSVLLKNLEL